MLSDANSSPISPEATEPARHRTRWRVAAVTLLVFIGIVFVIDVPIVLIVANQRPIELGGGITLSRVAGVLLIAIAAVLWFASAMMCWRGRWWFTCFAVAAAILEAAFANQLLADLHL